eukprot:CAMPEP_0182848652 /NCGR_PEP_ID=MMETSP0006_2-20121128/29116_1 /TAXON_ID=97485 /ORGANISM="Prymnesium parvum, Strain Texoma1" /LENGTH=83 /DNA_ID=CAMNT_0024979087 /DNA_START=342 /DNA_END=590 /DNA_ORIENTATION=-
MPPPPALAHAPSAAPLSTPPRRLNGDDSTARADAHAASRHDGSANDDIQVCRSRGGLLDLINQPHRADLRRASHRAWREGGGG